MKSSKFVLFIVLAFIFFTVTVFVSCTKGTDATPRVPPPPPILYGDSVAFSAKVYPTTTTNDINDPYLLGDSMYIPQDSCILTKMAFNVQNIGGYTTKCRFLVN